MPSAVILERRPEDGGIDVLARVAAAGPGMGAVALATDARYQGYVDTLLGNGITGPDGTRLFLRDGDAFVNALPDAMRGSRLWAEPVADGDE